MTTREIQGHLEEIYGVEVSPSLISSVTDAVIEEVKEWQSRPLEPLYPAVMGIKEHKYQFQTSSHEHTSLARLMFWSYVAMIGLSIPGIHYFGVLGFVGLWFIVEVFQVFAILRLNQRLFANVSTLDTTPVYRLHSWASRRHREHGSPRLRGSGRCGAWRSGP